MKAKLMLSNKIGSWQLSNILKFAAVDVGLVLDDVVIKKPYTVQFRLRLDRTHQPAKYQRTSFNLFRYGQKVNAVCWHGYRDFIRRCYHWDNTIEFTCGVGVYSINAPMKSIKYYSLEQFNAVYPETDYEVGGTEKLAFISQCCTCPEAKQ